MKQFKLHLFLLVFGYSANLVLAQTNITSIVNKYTKVTAFTNATTISVSNPAGFKPGDTVMIYQMKGIQYSATDPYTIDNPQEAGKYEIALIDTIISNQVTFRSPLLDVYDPAEDLQLIVVPYYHHAIFNISGFACNPWDPIQGTGGVFVVICDSLLELNKDIDVSGRGFIGAAPSSTASVICLKNSDPPYNILNYPDSSGLKGEGAVTTAFSYIRGYGPAGNGGGAGTGKYSGGGGGGNNGKGGNGSKEMCATGDIDPDWGGWGGLIDPQYFSNSNNRIFLGGGGGSGTQILSGGTSGGNGGGIVILLTPQLITHNHFIKAEGAAVKDTATVNASAGGGGGGGMVLLAVDSVKNGLNITVKGGTGGYTNAGVCTGQGGGGGGGFVWFSGNSRFFASIDSSAGAPGASATCTELSSTSGSKGKSLNNLILPLSGFLFNIIKGNLNICYNETQTLTGTQPKGGDGNYIYLWQYRMASTSWAPAPGINNQKTYTTLPLTDTIFFRRVVTSAGITDNSKEIKVNVFPQITNNIILTQDTSICNGSLPITIKCLFPVGGKGGFTYEWTQRTLPGTWNTPPGNQSSDFSNTSNTLTQYYRRKVTSQYCSTFDSVKVTVLPVISNNIIGTSQTICYHNKPAFFSGSRPTGGDNIQYSYLWQDSVALKTWKNSIVTDSAYSHPPVLDTTTSYRRLVMSGPNNCCYNKSSIITITVLPSITNNTIHTDQTICEGSKPASFTGSSPAGGDNTQPYRYQWERSYNNTSWNLITDSISKNYSSDTLITARYFKRIVRSGLNDCCRDTSLALKVTVQPKIKNNTIGANQTICQGFAPALLVSTSGSLEGGDGTTYTLNWWQKSTTGTWQNATGTYNQLSYQPSVLNDTMYYRRLVNSGQCTTYSNTDTITVLGSLAGNILTGNHFVCDGIPAVMITGGTMTRGEPGIYRYSWEKSTDSASWQGLSGETARDLNPGILPSNLYFRRIVKSGLNDCCSSTSAGYKIAINSLPTSGLLSYDTTICLGSSIPLKFSVSGSAPFQLKYTDGTAQFTKPVSASGTVPESFEPSGYGNSSISAAITIFSLSDINGCLATQKPGTVNVTGYKIPNAYAGVDTSVCGLNYRLEAEKDVGKGKWISSDVSFTTADSLPNASIVAGKYGPAVLLWKVVNGICYDSATLNVKFFEQPETPKLGPDTTLTYKFSMQLETVAPKVGSGIWSTTSDADIANVNDPVTQVTGLKFGKSVFYWTVTNGVCPSVNDSIVITLDDLGRYTGFSPNGDGINDFFVIEGLENAVKKELIIVNRWGVEVYHSTDYQNNWDGKNMDGTDLPEDTYYYILKVDDKRLYKGFVVIKR